LQLSVFKYNETWTQWVKCTFK